MRLAPSCRTYHTKWASTTEVSSTQEFVSLWCIVAPRQGKWISSEAVLNKAARRFVPPWSAFREVGTAVALGILVKPAMIPSLRDF